MLTVYGWLSKIIRRRKHSERHSSTLAEANFHDLPTELLLKIFDSIEFQDVIQCALVCRRFENIIQPNFSRYHLGSRSLEDVAQELRHRKGLRAHEELAKPPIVVSNGDRVDFYEYHPFSSRLFRTATSTKIRYDGDEDLEKAIPGTSYLIYCHGAKNFVIYDMKNDCEIARHKSCLPPHRMVYSKYRVGLGYSFGYNDLALYSWNEKEIKFLKVLVEVKDARLSDSGILVYQTLLRHYGRINFLHIHIDQQTDQIPFKKPIDLHYNENLLGISHNGELVVTMRAAHRQNEFSVYDTQSNELVLKFETVENFAYPHTRPFSDDCRFLLLSSMDKVLLVDIELKRKLHIPIIEPNYFSCTFRYINDVCHAQIINRHNVTMYKIDAHSRGWKSLLK